MSPGSEGLGERQGALQWVMVRNGNKVWGHRSGSSSCQILCVLSLLQIETYREKKKIQSFVLKYINSPGYGGRG